MKIISVKSMTYRYHIPEDQQFGNSTRWNTTKNTVLVEVKTDAGITGYGEADAAGGPAESTAYLIDREIGPYVIGKDPFCVDEIFEDLYNRSMIHGRRGIIMHAISGVDCALWDIIGKAAGQPVYKLLGGARTKVQAYHSGGFYRRNVPDTWYGEEARLGYEKGYRAFKMKIGRYDLERDAERVRIVREAIGPDSKLMVDVNSNYTVKQAIQMGEKLKPYNLFFMEEPVSVEDPEGSAIVARNIPMNLAGYETEYTRYGYRNLIDKRAMDIVQVDSTRCGGLTESRKIAAYASAHKLPVTCHAFAGGLTFLAGLHFVCGVDNGFLCECEVNPNPLRTDMFKNYRMELDEDGYITVPEKPGFGAEIDFDAIEQYRIG
ncbi:MAG: mandelate racemase/muconate lactonizing enzyme family protein [Solobacterium sp.]|nr:mandelate racemase/muconate lactonizing enzyme family protein [Solobacterium sp.]